MEPELKILLDIVFTIYTNWVNSCNKCVSMECVRYYLSKAMWWFNILGEDVSIDKLKKILEEAVAETYRFTFFDEWREFMCPSFEGRIQEAVAGLVCEVMSSHGR